MSGPLEPAMRDFLLGGTQVSSQVGTRVYPDVLPLTPVLPAVVYQRITTRRLHDMQGPDGLPRARMQLTIWADSAINASSVAALVRGRLDGQKGTWRDVEVQACLCVSDRNSRDNETGRCSVIQEYMIQYTEA